MRGNKVKNKEGSYHIMVLTGMHGIGGQGFVLDPNRGLQSFSKQFTLPLRYFKPGCTSHFQVLYCQCLASGRAKVLFNYI